MSVGVARSPGQPCENRRGFRYHCLNAIMDNGLNGMDKENEMNGWLRLWVVVCLILAICIGWYTALLLPNESRTTYYHESSINQLTGYLKEATTNTYSTEYIAGLREDIRKENEDFRKKLAKLPKERMEYIATAVGIWLGLSVVLYIAGWLVGWIYRGFRPKRV